jgi:3-methylcrotonyl-CoA carboxylase alpha subunit
MFRRLLIANRGEIACRIIDTARRLGVETVAVYSDADADARHVAMADRAVRLGPPPARESYLLADRILEAAAATGAEAIHPGYGFLSENAEFAEACAVAGIAFIGPPAAAIRAMGSKSEAKARMAEAGVPLTPGYHGADQDPDLLRAEAEKIGFPVLIKASAGGGGKGMRLVERADDFADALAGCKREATASFGDDRVLIERFVTRPRHIEMQIFADSLGNTVHLFERDCSIQRRHQKVVEEAPAPGMPEDLRAEMGAAAVAAAQAVGYVGAGTVEFIAETGPQGTPGAFFFMEMNTRLQVEHPVTEMITGFDLVDWQLRVAAGEALPCGQNAIAAAGHAVEVRLYAEDPDNGFLPSIGTLSRLRFPEPKDGVRVDTGVREGDAITPHYDPMIAKLIAHGSDRDEAIRRLTAALRRTEAAGIATNRDFLIRVLSEPDFRAGKLDTGFIASREETLLPGPSAPPAAVLFAATLALQHNAEAEARARAAALGDPHSPWAEATGWRLGEAGPVETFLRSAAGEHRLTARHDGAVWHCRAEADGVEPAAGAARLLSYDGGRLRFTLDGELHAVSLDRSGARLTVFTEDATFVLERIDPLAAAAAGEQTDHALTAPMPGRVTAVFVKPGDAVETGRPLMVLEAMKMEHTIKAPAQGTVANLPFAAGDQVADGAVLVTFEETEQTS